MTGLRASITRQMLLKGGPSTMEQAIEEAVVIEEALKFGGEVSEVNVNAVQKKEDSGELGQLKTLLMKKIDTLEAQMSEVKIGQRDMTTGRRHYQYERGGTQKCYRCGEQGHFKRACPLNFNKPAQAVEKSWRGNK